MQRTCYGQSNDDRLGLAEKNLRWPSLIEDGFFWFPSIGALNLATFVGYLLCGVRNHTIEVSHLR